MWQNLGMTTAPSRRLTRATAAHRRALQQLEVSRAELHAAIVEDLAAGVSQAALVGATGYTREQLRRIARAGGVGPAR
jgi:hypothetical protein